MKRINAIGTRCTGRPVIGSRLAAGVLALLLPLAMHSAPVSANEFREAVSSPNYLAEPPGVNLEMATAIVRSKTGGRVLSASPASRGAQRGYKVRVLVDDRMVQTWFVDRNGRTESD